MLALLAIAGDYWTPLKTSFAEALQINSKTINNKTVSISPNPCKGDLSVHYYSDKATTLHISVLNTVGNTIFASTQNVQMGANTIRIHLNVNTSGIYMLTLNNGTSQQKISFVVEK